MIGAASSASSLPDLKPLLLAVVGCNDSKVTDGKVIGDPMEAALLVLAHKGGVLHDEVARTLPRLAEVPFDAAHKFMATFHRGGAQVRVFINGAPDVLLCLCTKVLTENGASTIDPPAREQIQAHYAELAKQGLRGLLIASRTVDADSSGAPDAFNASGDLSAWVADLTFVALVGLVDPPRAESKAAIAQCRQAGITVKMITGDHPLTAAAIASQLGLDGRAMTGAELELIGPAELPDAIKNGAMFARVTPVTKVNIVRALQKSGHVVSMSVWFRRITRLREGNAIAAAKTPQLKFRPSSSTVTSRHGVFPCQTLKPLSTRPFLTRKTLASARTTPPC